MSSRSCLQEAQLDCIRGTYTYASATQAQFPCCGTNSAHTCAGPLPGAAKAAKKCTRNACVLTCCCLTLSLPPCRCNPQPFQRGLLSHVLVPGRASGSDSRDSREVGSDATDSASCCWCHTLLSPAVIDEDACIKLTSLSLSVLLLVFCGMDLCLLARCAVTTTRNDQSCRPDLPRAGSLRL